MFREKYGKASKGFKSQDGRAQKISKEKNVKPTIHPAESRGSDMEDKIEVRKISRN